MDIDYPWRRTRAHLPDDASCDLVILKKVLIISIIQCIEH